MLVLIFRSVYIRFALIFNLLGIDFLESYLHFGGFLGLKGYQIEGPRADISRPSRAFSRK